MFIRHAIHFFVKRFEIAGFIFIYLLQKIPTNTLTLDVAQDDASSIDLYVYIHDLTLPQGVEPVLVGGFQESIIVLTNAIFCFEVSVVV